MKKKFRKPKPSPPHWYWWDSDNCWDCNNRNNCGGKGCKRLKEIRAIENERRRKKEISRRYKEQFDD